jgi:hypothetical protein
MGMDRVTDPRRETLLDRPMGADSPAPIGRQPAPVRSAAPAMHARKAAVPTKPRRRNAVLNDAVPS